MEKNTQTRQRNQQPSALVCGLSNLKDAKNKVEGPLSINPIFSHFY
jgi:hypothetical protein